MRTFVIYGAPVAQGRARASRFGKKRVTMRDPFKSKAWKEFARLQVMGRRPEMIPAGSPVFVCLDFHMPRPKSYSRFLFWHVKKPDIDNLEKAILDGANGVLWADDSQVCLVLKRKIYIEADDRPKVVLTVAEATQRSKENAEAFNQGIQGRWENLQGAIFGF